MSEPQVTHFADDATLAHIAKLERELAEAIGLLGEARAEVLAQAGFHGCDNCNLTSMDVVKRIDAMLLQGPARVPSHANGCDGARGAPCICGATESQPRVPSREEALQGLTDWEQEHRPEPGEPS